MTRLSWMTPRIAIFAGVLGFGSLGLHAAGQTAPTTLPAAAAPKPSDILIDRPDGDVDLTGDLLGPVFESKGNGISVRPPKDSVPVRRVGAPEIIEFVNDSKKWSFKLSKLMLPKPGSLTESPDAQGRKQPGVLENTVRRLKEELPDAEFIRQEKINIGDGDVGMIVLRHLQANKPMLSQQAIVHRTDQLYYILTLQTPGSPKGTPVDQAGGNEKLAAETFRQILDSVAILDLGAVRQDQDLRLFRTRGLLVNFNSEKFNKAIVPQRWLRILKNGKDVGYTYIEEKSSIKGGQEGVEIRVRTRALPSAELQLDTGSIFFASMDLRHEDWSTLTEAVSVKEKAKKDYKAPQISELGLSDRRSVPGQGDVYSLQVMFESTKEHLPPLARELPPFYLPQAISHLLPRLVPLNEPKTFMFMTYVPETREVMSRYIDVLDSKKIEFNNRIERAIPVEDRIGLEGPITTHYLSPTGQYLGSESRDGGLTVVPSDEETLTKLWKDVNLTLPEPKAVPEQPAAETPERPTVREAVRPGARLPAATPRAVPAGKGNGR